MRTFRAADAAVVYAHPAPQLRRLEQLGVLHRLAHGYYTVVPQDQIGTNWMPTLEAAAAGIAAARFHPDRAPLMGVSAARLHGALPRALAVAIVAAPAKHDPITLLGIRVRKHLLGSDVKKDPVVYEELDHSYYMGVSRSGDGKYVVIDEQSTLSSEVRFIPASQPKAKFKVLTPREHDFEYHAEHIDQRWVIRTNWNAKNFRVMQVDDARVGDKKGGTKSCRCARTC
jgi:hypothetical protein